MEPKIGEHWSNQQREGHALHQTPYFGAFQPALARFFIDRYTKPGQTVFDPFAGRGTTALEASLCGRTGLWREKNPYGRCLIQGKAALPRAPLQRLRGFLEKGVGLRVTEADINMWQQAGLGEFFHRNTVKQLISLRHFGTTIDPYSEAVLKMLVCITMTGHSPGYLSVRTMPPNQQILPGRQATLNEKAKTRPPHKDVSVLLWRRALRLLKDGLPEKPILELKAGHKADLLITSPPFLDVIDYEAINWIRLYWLGARPIEGVIMEKSLEAWRAAMRAEMVSWRNYLTPAATICIEAGKVRKSQVDLCQEIMDLAPSAGYSLQDIYIQETEHTRTARCWGVKKDQGTTTQQVAIFRLQ